MPIMNFMTTFYNSPAPHHRSLRKSFLKIFPVIITVFVLIWISSCEEEGTFVGEDVLPGSDFVSVFSTDTVTVRSFTQYDDSIVSSNTSSSYLGQVYDPYFGTTTAEFVTQLRLQEKWTGSSFTIDSVKLGLTLTNVTGNTDQVHYLEMSEIAEQLYTDSTYYSNRKVPLTGYKVSGIHLPALQADTVNNIVLDIPVEFGYYVMKDTSMLFHSNTVDDFRSYFKGLKFSLKSLEDPAFLTLSLAPPSVVNLPVNYFVIYLHDADNKADEFLLILDAKTNNARMNLFTHDFSTAEPGKKIEHINDGIRDSVSYLQGLNGVYTRMKIPGLTDIKNNPLLSKISVNKARIICPVWYDGSIYKASTFPSQLYMRYSTTSGIRYLMPDYYISNTFFDGAIDTVKNTYSFNIASYVQSYLEDTKGTLLPEFELVLPSGLSNNAILRANENSVPVKFEFTYTRNQ